MGELEFLREINNIIEELRNEFEEKGKEAPFAFAIEVIKKVKDTNDTKAREILEQILEGISLYRSIRTKADTKELSELVAGKISQDDCREIEETIKMLVDKISLE